MAELPPRLRIAADHLDSGRFEQARAALARFLVSTPNSPIANAMMASVCLRLGEPDRAVFLLQRAREGDPSNPDLLSNLGNALLSIADCAAAAATYRDALAIAPTHPSASTGLVCALNALMQLDEADRIGQAAEAHWPTHTELLINRAATHLQSGRAAEAVRTLRTILAAQPDNLAAADSLAFTLNYTSDITPAALFDAHQRYGALLKAQSPAPLPPRPLDPSGKLRVGLVSADLRTHSVGRFNEPWLSAHDRSQFEVFCYSTSLREDQTTNRLKTLTHRWHTIPNLPTLDLARLIRNDRIDILIDLSGHTAGNRLPVFQLRPAPIQATYLGYPATTGVQTIDFRLVDALTDPEQTPGTEQLARIETCFVCFTSDSPPIRPSRTDRPFTLGSFNALSKLSERTVSLWTAVMHALPNAHLLLKNESLSQPDVRQHTEQRLAAAGINPSRITLRGSTPTQHEHLDLYNDIDLALDTFPYHGTTTTCEALAMGVPVITLTGDPRLHAARVGASLLTAAGSPELIASAQDQFIRIALTLAAKGPRSIEDREALRDRTLRSELCNVTSFARRFDAALNSLCSAKRPG